MIVCHQNFGFAQQGAEANIVLALVQSDLGSNVFANH